ncbi:MAG: aminodeoxychorismate synthase component I [Chloroflexi bacterium AL-W]|nr:aminodeoxychorismate synthase component I [Chloroflexi bacterium AL-N1]NOK71309.1 aminodeoxychorismate synthase component I [Chloroflexi bacterium AL-N10]NOK77684.1 aminodeoxychorismate synthase component I [Chloroflexi bacterium AL-N5]NOK84535.1 aminodeoxychorismate synthase component I [Chloroflexi bacterium AL-W]NOK92986.1 aminodeoxychorismate synthase component I [Chloroflexi bacterium AL-N15]
MTNQQDIEPPLLHFDFYDHQGVHQPVCFTNPVQVVAATRVDEVQQVLHLVQRAVDRGCYAAGFVSYEAAPAFDPAFVVQSNNRLPLAWFGLFEAPTPLFPPTKGAFHLSDWTPDVRESEFADRIAAIRSAIERGDTYQVNYTLRLHAQCKGDDWALYQHLYRAQQANYCAYLNLGRYRILSVSPELFFRWDGQQLMTRPMKGTMPRGRWPDEDRVYAAQLAVSEKDRAENLMIVDLLRNDIGRVAAIGSVQVPELFTVERYPTVWQMTSTITAESYPDTTLNDIMTALFPCGSITGAPKISTMQYIATLENSPRDVYCGAIGYIAPGNQTVFNVAIRTMLLDTQTNWAVYGVGSGITWDSTATGEYAEVQTKAALLTEPQPVFELLETLLLDHGTYTLLDRHLQRLSDSSAYFGIPLVLDTIHGSLMRYAQRYQNEMRRVRLLVARDGTPRIESTPYQPLPDTPQPVALAYTPISSKDRFLYHKTTHRAVYDTHRSAHTDVFDVLLWNQADELTEFTIGNLVLELDDRRWTPPQHCGLLAGVLRGELIAQGAIHERVLTRADLAQATRIWLINSVRGWVRVYFMNLMKNG